MSDARKSGKKNQKNSKNGLIPGPFTSGEGPARVWVVGGGQMGGVIVRHIAAQRLGVRLSPAVVDPNPEILKAMKQEGIEADSSLGGLARKDKSPDMVLLAVKPGVFLKPDSEVAGALSGLPPGILAISVMAGVSLSHLRDRVPNLRWVRAMTNLALSSGKGMTLLAASSEVTHSEQSFVYSLFSEMGRALWLPEDSFDAATAIAGSGPGLLSLVAEALADGGVREGLSRETATLLASWALLGTGALLADKGHLPELLKAKVASPSGTTIEGLAVLERHGVRGVIIDAVRAMAARSREMSRNF
ncbi:MAG: pyrroline-5-carboxylate reductase [Nitrospirae bacterium]|nr:pyrroline-5-carboxylate reductase [Nitrospirota bacterium]MCL5286206.1 pyrroline-5-carboxylate reductase [Nitrospirota bacterium]